MQIINDTLLSSLTDGHGTFKMEKTGMIGWARHLPEEETLKTCSALESGRVNIDGGRSLTWYVPANSNLMCHFET